MQEQILRKIFLGFIHIHILHHAKKEPFYGSWMIEELKSHGYDISPGTLYPILKAMEQ
ncbi:PadR family transcriptional regulator, partial [Acinetobacter sp. RIT592]